MIMKAALFGTTAAIAVQPLVALCWIVTSLLGAKPTIDALAAAQTMAIVTALATPFVLVIGLPSLLVLRRLKRLSAYSLGLVGCISATIILASWSGLDWPSIMHEQFMPASLGSPAAQRVPLVDRLKDMCTILLLGAAHGGSAGVVGYFVWRRSQGRITHAAAR
jgi:hypothetical protein